MTANHRPAVALVGLGRMGANMARRLARAGLGVAAFEAAAAVREAIELGTPLPVISAALMVRFASQDRADYAAQFLARLRHAFGGHFLPKDGR